ncbi:MAG: hypothetical protein ACRDGA_02195, partial [Bacteroidota bacterium]
IDGVRSRPTTKPLRPLWTCPKCGNTFVSKNLWHSCVRFDSDYHFQGKDPALKRAFLKFQAMFEKCGVHAVHS